MIAASADREHQAGSAGTEAAGAVTVEICGEDRAAEWDSWVMSHPGGTVYHLWRWRQVFAGVFGHEVIYLAARRGPYLSGVLPLVIFRTALFGRFVVSLPFVNYGGVLADDRDSGEALLDEALRVAGRAGAKHVELRHTDQRFPALAPKRHKVAMVLDLEENADSAWKRLDRKVRNQVRKAEKSGLTATVGGAELVREFHTVFARNMRDLGTPAYTRRFFETVAALFPDGVRIVVVRQGTTAAAAGLTIVHRDRMELPWASSLREFLPSCANMLLYWTAFQQAIAAGARVFDFGRSTPGEGTFHFKRQWGASPVPLCWEYALLNGGALPDQSPKNPRFRQAIAVWRRLPLVVTNAAGPLIVRQIP